MLLIWADCFLPILGRHWNPRLGVTGAHVQQRRGKREKREREKREREEREEREKRRG